MSDGADGIHEPDVFLQKGEGHGNGEWLKGSFFSCGEDDFVAFGFDAEHLFKDGFDDGYYHCRFLRGQFRLVRIPMVLFVLANPIEIEDNSFRPLLTDLLLTDILEEFRKEK